MNDRAQRGLDEHLDLLRATQPTPGAALARSVVRTARWQGAVRAPLRVAGMIGTAVVQGAAALLGSARR